MPVPTYDRFIEPILRYLAARPDGALARDVYEAAADVLALSDADRAELLPSGAQAVYKNRAGWAHDRLKRAGYSQSLRRGYWRLTDAGAAYALSHPAPLPDTLIEQVATGNMSIRLRAAIGGAGELVVPDDTGAAVNRKTSPDDRLEQALRELRQSIATEVSDELSRVSSHIFETIVLDLDSDYFE